MELQGAVRGGEGYAGKVHSNGATVAWIVSKSHFNILNDKLTGVDVIAIEDINGNEILKTITTTSAVNELTITNQVTGTAPLLAATGGDTNIGLDVSTKGTGSFIVWAGNKARELLKLANVASAVNEVQISPSATTVNPIIEVTGDDTNIGLDISTKGTGGWTAWAGSKTRELLILLNVASAVNEVSISPAVTGGNPQIAATGGDTNVALVLIGKGAKGVVITDLAPTVSALTDGANIATNAALGNIFTVTLAGNRTMDAPTNPTLAQSVEYWIKQDATGSRLITWSSAAGGFSFGTETAIVLTTTAAKVDRVSFRYDSTLGKFLFGGITKGF